MYRAAVLNLLLHSHGLACNVFCPWLDRWHTTWGYGWVVSKSDMKLKGELKTCTVIVMIHLISHFDGRSCCIVGTGIYTSATYISTGTAWVAASLELNFLSLCIARVSLMFMIMMVMKRKVRLLDESVRPEHRCMLYNPETRVAVQSRNQSRPYKSRTKTTRLGDRCSVRVKCWLKKHTTSL
jgi:hypothetical protein